MLDSYKNEQPIVYQILVNAINNNKLSHAYLFETNGYSKCLDMAIAFAKSLLCPNNLLNKEKCKNCSQCKNIDENNFLELKIIEPDGQWIKKNQLQELQDIFSKKAIVGNKKIYIINEADKLNESASNSLLKFLEEPEEGIIAILITDNVYQLLNTIISRCQILSFKKNEKQISDSTMKSIAQYLFNSEEEINNFIEDEKNIEKVVKVVEFIEYYETKREKTILFINKLWNDYFSNREDIQFAFDLLLLYYNDVLNYLLGRNLKFFMDYNDSIKKISNMNELSVLSNKIKKIVDLKNLIKYNINTGLLMDKLIIDLRGCEIDD